ncbi:hypothetical protein AXF42_Ash007698 [Apostasia shenzhenica]|uniref:RRM domain-containing protein n=1 Tax=Apostasia shenzhenica TaxID=1088818 RepID=A0A2I0A673_9ASPA|nr:hypothetical protein AXF42_Ash007698 [Apostasia shenzhenica]
MAAMAAILPVAVPVTLLSGRSPTVAILSSSSSIVRCERLLVCSATCHPSSGRSAVIACTPSSAPKEFLRSSTKLFVSVNLVMDRIANRPRGFAFLRYATKEESKRAIDGMHGKVNVHCNWHRSNHRDQCRIDLSISSGGDDSRAWRAATCQLGQHGGLLEPFSGSWVVRRQARGPTTAVASHFVNGNRGVGKLAGGRGSKERVPF